MAVLLSAKKLAWARRTFNIFQPFQLFFFCLCVGLHHHPLCSQDGSLHQHHRIIERPRLYHLLHVATRQAHGAACLDHKDIRLGLGHPLHSTSSHSVCPPVCLAGTNRAGDPRAHTRNGRLPYFPRRGDDRQQPCARPALLRRRRQAPQRSGQISRQCLRGELGRRHSGEHRARLPSRRAGLAVDIHHCDRNRHHLRSYRLCFPVQDARARCFLQQRLPLAVGRDEASTA